jgi:RNA polymerase sigma factor (sigma-70 family)
MYGDVPDAELLALASSGDRGAFTALFRRHSRSVYRYAWGLTGGGRDAEDVTQEVFTIAWRRVHELRVIESSALPWLLVTAKNVARNLGRVRRHEELPPELAAQGGEHGEELRWVLGEIEKLGGTDQRVVRLCLIEGYSYAEASEQLGLSVSALAKRVERIRVGLRRAVRGVS